MRLCCDRLDTCENDIDGFGIDELLDEINNRLPKGYSPLKLIAIDDIDIIKRSIEATDSKEAIWLLDTAIFPKWRRIEDCREAWKRAVAPPPPLRRIGLWQHL